MRVGDTLGVKQVYQDRVGWGEGNCVWACIATIFRVPLDELRFPPPTMAEVEEWTERCRPALAFRYADLGQNFRLEGSGYERIPEWGRQRWTYDVAPYPGAPTEGLWMATVPSRGLSRPADDPYYPMPAMHCVVMRGDDIVHDPHPSYELAPYDEVHGMAWWEPKEERT